MQHRAGDGGIHADPIELRQHGLGAQRDRGVAEVGHHGDAAGHEPLTNNGKAIVGLVLMVGAQDFNRAAENGATEIGCRQLRGDNTAPAG